MLHRRKCCLLCCLQSRPRLVNKKILMDLIGLELIALVVIVGYKLSPMLLPKADVTVQPDPACNLQQSACSVSLPGGGTVTLDVSARPVPLVKPFEIEVRTQGVEVRGVEVDLAGIDMNMGYNRPVLAARGDGRYAAEATLPVCITGGMDWQATVLIETASQQIAIPYRFNT